jgi:O-antigen/teichoic acid export membrane protein
MQKHVSLGLFFFASLTHSIFYWLLSSVISKTRGTEALGELSFLLSLLAPVALLAGLQLKNYYLSKNIGDEWREVLFLRLIFSQVIFFISLVFLLFFYPDMRIIAVPLTLLRVSELWSEVCQIRWQKQNQLFKASISIFSRYFISIVICIYFLFWNSRLNLFNVLATLGIIVALIDTLVDPFTIFSWAPSRSLFITVLKLCLSALLTSLLVNLPRYLLKSFHGDNPVGVFSALFYFYAIPTMLINIGLQGVIHRINGIREKGLLKIGPSILLFFSILIFLGLHFYGADFMSRFYSIQIVWGSSYSLLITASFFLGGVNTLMQYSLLGLNIYNVQLTTSFVAFLVAALSGFLLIPAWSIFGAFASFLLGLLIQFIFYTHSYVKSNYG